jgi:hypothetical protein
MWVIVGTKGGVNGYPKRIAFINLAFLLSPVLIASPANSILVNIYRVPTN